MGAALEFVLERHYTEDMGVFSVGPKCSDKPAMTHQLSYSMWVISPRFFWRRQTKLSDFLMLNWPQEEIAQDKALAILTQNKSGVAP